MKNSKDILPLSPYEIDRLRKERDDAMELLNRAEERAIQRNARRVELEGELESLKAENRRLESDIDKVVELVSRSERRVEQLNAKNDELEKELACMETYGTDVQPLPKPLGEVL